MPIPRPTVAMLKELLFKKSIDVAFTRISETIRKSKAVVQTTTDEVDIALQHHIKIIKNWASEISFADLRNPKSTHDVFLPLDVLLHPRRMRMEDEGAQVLPLERLISNSPSRHIVILGQPGAGKTTSMKHLCYRLLHQERFLAQIDLPLLLRLQDLNPRSKSLEVAEKVGDDDLLISTLQDVIGIRITYPPDLLTDEKKTQRRSVRDRIVIDFLDSLKALIILDGFDEIVAKTRKEAVISQLRILALQLESSRIILTSRTGEFNYHIDKMAQFELSPLSASQLSSFVSGWLGNDDDGRRLLEQIKKSPFADTAIRPLTIAHLCAIFERAGRIPDKPKTVYRKIVNLLLAEWDEQRSVRRETSYANFEIDRKFEFLTNLAYVLTLHLSGPKYSKRDLINGYEDIHENFGLPRDEATKVANELETHTGLFIQSGYEAFEFSHKSLQEYLTAEFIVRLPTIPAGRKLLLGLPNELAIAVAISSRPSHYFAFLIFERFQGLKLSFSFIRTFVTRLLLESPDFERNSLAGSALLALYSQYLQAVEKISKQLPLFIFDQLSAEFSEIGSMVKERVSMSALLELYAVAGRSAGLDGHEIMVLTRIEGAKSSQGSRRPHERLPNEVWVRQSLLEET